MAQSRLEKIGTIFTRVTGLLKSGAMKAEDKPLWYDVYAAFPPKLEPRFDRPAPTTEIRNILYEEDVVRAKYHKSLRQPEALNLSDRKYQTQSQHFIKIYQGLKSQGALDEEKVFETSLELLQQQRAEMKAEAQELAAADSAENEDEKPSLSLSFAQAKKAMDTEKGRSDTSSSTEKRENKNSLGGIDIKNLFKD